MGIPDPEELTRLTNQAKVCWKCSEIIPGPDPAHLNAGLGWSHYPECAAPIYAACPDCVGGYVMKTFHRFGDTYVSLIRCDTCKGEGKVSDEPV